MQDRNSILKALGYLLRPQVIILIFTLLLLSKVILMGRLVYGDIPFFSVDQSKVNFLYTWGPEQFGTNVRQGLNTVRDGIFQLISVNDLMYYFLKYVLPLVLLPLNYWLLLRKIGIKNRLVLILASVFPLFTPIVFGDFLNGQTFWVYLTVPWVYYFALKIFNSEQFKLSNFLLLGVWLFLSLGALPPVIVPLVATLFLIVVTSFVLNFRLSFSYIAKYVAAGFVAFLTFGLLAFPYLFAATSGSSAFTPASLMGDYYNNYADTDLVNTFRGSGNNGSGQKTLHYNVPALTNAIGYLFFAVIIAGSLLLLKKDQELTKKKVVICMLVPMLAILGFMHIMATDPVIGTKVFQSQWIVSTIRNPSKLYLLILPLMTVLVAIALHNYLRRYRSLKHYAMLGGIMLVLLGGYGWPALRGDLGLLYGREDKISHYYPDQKVLDMVHKVTTDSRSILAPSDHEDELNYQNVNPGFNVLRLEGGAPHTTEYIKEMKEAFNAKNRYLFNYMASSGVENLFLQKDPQAYEGSRFGLFALKLGAGEARDFAATKLPLKDETADYWHFANGSSNKLVYSPTSMTNINGSDSLVNKAPFLFGKSVVTDGEALGKQASPFMEQYVAKERLAAGETIADGKAQLHDPGLLLANIYYQDRAGARDIMLDILNPISRVVQSTQRIATSRDASVLLTGDDEHSFTKDKKTITLRSGSRDFTPASTSPLTDKNFDGSFEKQIPKVGDATAGQAGKAKISANRSTDVSDGKQSMELKSSNHTAFVCLDLPIGKDAGQYLVRFDTKNTKGSSAHYSVLNDETTLTYGGSSSSDSRDWQTTEAYFDYKPENGADNKVRLYLYTSPDDGESANLFDNIRILKVNKEATASVALANYEPDYQLQNYVNSQDNSFSSNLLKDGSFESADLWGGARDATASAHGQARVKAVSSSDAVDGDKALKLESSNHTAYVTRRVSGFTPNNVYRLSMSYKNVSGRKPTYAVWQNGKNIAQPSAELKGAAGQWHQMEVYFVPDEKTTALTVYLYSPSNGERTINLFDDVKVEKASLIATFLEKKGVPSAKAADIVASYQRINPTEIVATVRKGTGAIVFNESFQKGWKAYAVPKDFRNGLSTALMLKPPGQELKNHAIVNGFANGWWVDSSQLKDVGDADEYKVVMLYMPQKNMYRGLLISGTTALLLAVYFLVGHIRRGGDGDDDAGTVVKNRKPLVLPKLRLPASKRRTVYRNRVVR